MNNKNNSTKKLPFQIKNIRFFIAFRVLFNSRFYYPVFTILFLDFGLSVAQFAILNAIWAATIVAAEVPSGALADLVGRKTLLVTTGSIMVFEVAILCFSPIAGSFSWFTPQILFTVFAINRILSGLAEASASGADEALAYDALKKEGDPSLWGKVLDVQMRIQALGGFVAMIIGAAAYDPALINKIFGLFNHDIHISQSITMRLPLFFTLITAIGTLITAILMDDFDKQQKNENKISVKETFKLTLLAGKWILNTPFALAVISAGLIFDGIIRMIITLASQYYRLINLPEASFGIIGAVVALMGIIIPKISLSLSKKYHPKIIFLIITLITLTGLFGMKYFIPYYGLIAALILFSAMSMTGFFVSLYLNQLADSKTRATILSFKGLAFNLSYGILGILYSLLLAHIKGRLHILKPHLIGDSLENFVFIKSFGWFPWIFIISIVIFSITAILKDLKSQ